ncbi:hypothetical protein WA026_004493 [Henosepilachna vigintioctopunctata]
MSSRKKRPERQLYIPPAQRKLASSKDSKCETKSGKTLGVSLTNETVKPVIEIESKNQGIDKQVRERSYGKEAQKCENSDMLKSSGINDTNRMNIDEFSAQILHLHDLMQLNLLPLRKYFCNVTYKIDRNFLSLKNCHEGSCEFYKYLLTKFENELDHYIPIYHLSDLQSVHFLIDNYLCWQPTSTDDLINFDEIFENNCAIPFFNYIKNADLYDFLKSDLDNGFSINQINLFMKIKACEVEHSKAIVNPVCDTSEARIIFDEDINTSYLLRIICDNEPFENIVDLTEYSMGHYFRIINIDGSEFFHVCDEKHDIIKCYMESKEKTTDASASKTKRNVAVDKIEPKIAESEVINSNIKNKNKCENAKIEKPDLRVITNPDVKAAKSNDTKNKCKHEEEKEIMRKAKENINRKTRPLMKYSDDSDDLLKIDKQDNVNSWEDLFDENGQLQEELLTEIVHKVGKDMTIVKATEDYTPYMQKQSEDLEHVVEIYNFSPSLSTGDIIHAFNIFDSNSMYIVWVDDTHALLVLGSSSQAQRAIQMRNPLIKVRPMSQASPGAAAMASQYDLKPAMKRPATNLQTARRLITNHLGTKSTLTKEQSAREREHLRKAREQRKITKQNEKDAWEGNIRSSLR